MKCVKRRLTKRIDKTYNDKFYKTNKKLMDILSEGEQWGHKPANQESVLFSKPRSMPVPVP